MQNYFWYCTLQSRHNIKMALQNTINTTEVSLDTEITVSDAAESSQYISFRVMIYVYILPVLCFFGICGNIISILIIGKDYVVRRATGFLLQVLAFTDILYLLLNVLLLTLKTISEYTDWSPLLQWYFPYTEPFLWPLASIAQTCEVWIVVLVTADRYFAVCKALHAARYLTMSRTCKAVLLIYILSVLYNLPRFWERTTQYGRNSRNQTVPICIKTELRESKEYMFIYKTCCFFVFRFCLPIISLTFFNTRLVQAVKHSIKQRKELSGNHKNLQQDKLNRETIRYTITLLVVVFVFIICATPDYFLRLWVSLDAISNVFYPKELLKFINVVSTFLLALNSCSNFVIYCFLGKRFRKILCQTLCWFTS